MDKNINKFIYYRHANIIFSLNGSRVKEFKFHNKMLTLKVDSLFQYVNNEEVEHEGEVCFKEEGVETGIQYQTLINLYLTECVKEKKNFVLTAEPL